MKEIILASASPRRLELLNQVRLSFTVIPSEVEENMNEPLGAAELAEKLSFEKALSVAKNLKRDAIVIGADTIVVKDMVLGKPQNKEDARKMLKSLQGDWHEVITGISIVDGNTFASIKGHESTRVKMRNLTDREIDAYIETGEPMDKAGAYGIQGMGAVLVERLEGCYFNVVGLPLTRLSNMLHAFGVRVL